MTTLRLHRLTSGFTLLELMLVVVIIGVLAASAYPSYRSYMVQTRRSDAQIALTQAANQQERFFTECNWYAATLTGARACGTNTTGVLGLSGTSPQGYYTLSAPVAANINGNCTGGSAAFACGFTMTAAPVATGPQAGNGDLRIDALGTKEWN